MDGSLELIQSYTKNGDAQAFAAIVREYQGLVYRVCLRIHGNTHQAEDSTQECFLLLARDAGKVKKSLPGWLHRCATHVALGSIRSEEARRKREYTYGQGVETMKKSAEWEEITQEVDKALDKLPDELREILVEHFLCQRPQSDIARDLGVSNATVSRQMERAIQALQNNLKKSGVIVTASVLAVLLAKNATAAAVPASVGAALGKIALASGAKASAVSVGTTVMGGSIVSTTKIAVIAGVAVFATVAYMMFKPTEPKPTLPGEMVDVEADLDSENTTEEPPFVAPIATELAETEPQEVPINDVDDMEAATKLTFDGDDANLVWAEVLDAGFFWSIEEGAGRFAGTLLRDTGRWRVGTFNFPVDIDSREKLEVSGEFKVADYNGYHLITLWAPPDLAADCKLCMYYESQGTSPTDGHYVIQTRWLNKQTTMVEGNRTMPAFGDEADVFHTMKMLLDRPARTIAYYVDEKLIGIVSYEGEIPQIINVGMGVETPRQGTTLDIRYDNVYVRSFGPMYTPPEPN